MQGLVRNGVWVGPRVPTAEPVQAMAAEWISTSNPYTRTLAKGISHEDWERKLQKMCAQGHNGPHGVGAKRSNARPKKWSMEQYTADQYRQRHARHFTKAKPRSEEVRPVLTGKPPVKEKPMRIPLLEDTIRITQLIVNVAEQDAQREKFKDIHDDEWYLKWLKSRGTVEVPELHAHRVKRRAARHRWDEATDEVYLVTHAGKELRVPKPGDRLALVKEYPERSRELDTIPCPQYNT
ncbi:hypothetical protein CYMTET_40580 [Cymbomonas tetramitiformis]|uniref:Uncharacterized protein n=1 Tax=Cymbomonas tetramitiformis TaxID=36881 RepID=A0AAE0F341_9CHLO|nr:hypothetical protein CYMTET_40580 [Cymbomonas tetramitiformis]